MRTRWLNLRSNQRGDTIIEVLIAITILSTVLFSAYALANQTAKLGLSAREQDQSTQLLQHQAEGLRHMRDNADNWNEFTDAVDQYNRFHTRINSGSDEWEIRNGKGNGGQVIDNSFSLFTTWAEVVSTGGDDNRRDITIYVEWETVNGKKQTSTTDVVLVNTDSLAPPSRLEPNVTCNDLDANPDSGTKPLHVDFTVDYDAEDTSIDHFEFDFGDGSSRTSNNNHTNHTYTNSGSYTATVEIHPRDGETATCHTGVNVAAQSETFTYAGSTTQYYQVPSGVNEIQVNAWGAQGGHAPGRSYGGGKGGYTRATVSVTPGETLYIYVGGKGGPARNNAGASGGDGGWPNGGDGGDGGATTGSGAGGGGASMVRQPNNNYKRIVVAAGGGGSTRRSCSSGGDGGGTAGEDGEDSHSSGGYGVAEGGGGGTQSSPGDGGSGYGSEAYGQDGGWSTGGDGGTSSGGGAGGGGGGFTYGGGGGGSVPYSCAGAGGGGASYTAGYNSVLHTGVKSGHGRIKITPL